MGRIFISCVGLGSRRDLTGPSARGPEKLSYAARSGNLPAGRQARPTFRRTGRAIYRRLKPAATGCNMVRMTGRLKIGKAPIYNPIFCAGLGLRRGLAGPSGQGPRSPNFSESLHSGERGPARSEYRTLGGTSVPEQTQAGANDKVKLFRVSGAGRRRRRCRRRAGFLSWN